MNNNTSILWPVIYPKTGLHDSEFKWFWLESLAPSSKYTPANRSTGLPQAKVLKPNARAIASLNITPTKSVEEICNLPNDKWFIPFNKNCISQRILRPQFGWNGKGRCPVCKLNRHMPHCSARVTFINSCAWLAGTNFCLFWHNASNKSGYISSMLQGHPWTQLIYCVFFWPFWYGQNSKSRKSSIYLQICLQIPQIHFVFSVFPKIIICIHYLQPSRQPDPLIYSLLPRLTRRTFKE